MESTILSRKNIFEILQDNFNYMTEISTIDELYRKMGLIQTFDDYGIPFWCSVYQYLYKSNCFEKWIWRGFAVDVAGFEFRLGITDLLRKPQLEFSNYLPYLEYVVNMYFLCEIDQSNGKCVLKDDHLVKNITMLLEDFNFETKYFPDEKRALIVEKNRTATTAAEIVKKEDTSKKIIEYNHYLLKGDLQRKREILVSIGDEFEPIRKKLELNSYRQVASDTAFLLNKLNIRHNNSNGKDTSVYKSVMNDDELESWYDKTYNMLLLSFITNDYVSTLSKEIDELKKHD